MALASIRRSGVSLLLLYCLALATARAQDRGPGQPPQEASQDLTSLERGSQGYQQQQPLGGSYSGATGIPLALTLNRLYDLRSLIARSMNPEDNYLPKQAGSQRADNWVLGKRQGFSAWAGKRNMQPTDSKLVVSLRSFLQNKLRDLGTKRQQFSAWAGKRAGLPLQTDHSTSQDSNYLVDDKQQDTNNNMKNINAEETNLQKRANSDEEDTQSQNLETILSSIRNANVDRRAFSAWSGKRGFSAWAGKRNEK